MSDPLRGLVPPPPHAVVGAYPALFGVNAVCKAIRAGRAGPVIGGGIPGMEKDSLEHMS